MCESLKNRKKEWKRMNRKTFTVGSFTEKKIDILKYIEVYSYISLGILIILCASCLEIFVLLLL